MRIARTKSDIKNQLYWNKKGRLLRRRIIDYYTSHLCSDEEKEVVGYLKRNRISLLPYTFTKHYKSKNVIVKYEPEDGFPYVEFDEKHLYYRKDWSRKKIKQYHANLLAEQDTFSPHFYPIEKLSPGQVSAVIDAGGAEGIFSLLIIDKVEYIYIIEPDPYWTEALIKTFSPWKEKVIVVAKYLSDSTTDNSISIDHYFGSKEIGLIKIDVEGYERKVLAGSLKLLSSHHDMLIFIAAYHKQGDQKVLDNILAESGFETTYSKGFIPFYYDLDIDNPLLRRGLIYAEKKGKKEISSV